MTPAVYEATKWDFGPGERPLPVRATGSRVVFDGYHALYSEAHEAEDAKTLDSLEPIPPLAQGDRVTLKQSRPQPALYRATARFSEASL